MKFVAFLITFVLMSFFAFSQKDVSKLVASLNSAHTDDEKIKAYGDIFQYYQFINPDSAEHYIGQGLSNFKSDGNDKGIAAMSAMYGNLYSSHGRLEMAKEMLQQALPIYEQLKDKKNIAQVHDGIGVIDGKTGKYIDATKHFMVALKNYEDLKDSEGVVQTYMRLGEVNGDNDNLDKALEYYNTALDYAAHNSVTGNVLIDVYNNIGIVYAKKMDHAKAISHFEKVLAACTGPQYIVKRIHTLNNIGIIYDEMGEGKKSLLYFEEGLRLARDKKLPEEYATLEVSMASVIGKTNPAAAIATLKEALDTAKAIGLQSLESVIYDNLIEVYEQTGNYKEALTASELLKKIDDSLFNINKAKEIANLQAVRELEQSNARLTLSEQKSQTIELIRDVIVVVAIVLAILLLLLFIVYKRSMQLNRELEKREAELKKSNEIKDRLFSIIGHDLRGPIGNVAVMLQLLQHKNTAQDDSKFILDRMVVHAKATVETLDKLLYWGQSQIKGIGMNQVSFAIGQHVQNCIELLRPAAEQKAIKIVDNIPTDTIIYADPVHFDFTLRNLLSNAVKFTHNNGVVELNANKKPGFVVFGVKDNGIGIGKDKVKDIFKPFSNSTLGTNDEKGTSIGLMLCKEFVTENGGDIWVETEEGKGSTFYFSLKASA